MADSYLTLAKKIISAHGKPMSAQHILYEAKRFGMLPNHLHGKTMQKTLQARITEDINLKRNQSDFYRTNIGTYFLRPLLNDTVLPSSVISEFTTESKRNRPLPKGRTLFTQIPNTITNSGVLAPKTIKECINNENVYHYLEDAPQNYTSVSTFTFIELQEYFFSFTVGKHSHFTDQINKKSIGFRRHVSEFDNDLFSDGLMGIDTSASREALYQYIADDQNRDKELINNLGFLGGFYESTQNRLSLIFKYDQTKNKQFNPNNFGRLEINQPDLISKKISNLTSYDLISKAVIEKRF